MKLTYLSSSHVVPNNDERIVLDYVPASGFDGTMYDKHLI